MSNLPKAQPNKTLYARKNPDGTTTYYQATQKPTPNSVPVVQYVKQPIQAQQAKSSPYEALRNLSKESPKSDSPKETQLKTSPMEAEVSVTNTLIFYVNGKKQVVYDMDPRTTLNDYLRSSFGLTGTKKMCGEVNIKQILQPLKLY